MAAKEHEFFNDDVFQQILDRVSDGQTLRNVARSLKFERVSFYRWLDADKSGERANRYARSRELQMESHADDILEDAEDSSRDTITLTRRDGTEYEAPDHEWIARSRLRVDTKKWLMSKLYPRRYAERIEQTISVRDGKPLDGLSTEEKIAALRATVAPENAGGTD